MIYIIQIAFQDYDSEHYNHWISYSNVAYCSSRAVAEKEITRLLSLKELTTYTVELRDFNEVRTVDLYSIVEQELLH